MPPAPRSALTALASPHATVSRRALLAAAGGGGLVAVLAACSASGSTRPTGRSAAVTTPAATTPAVSPSAPASSPTAPASTTAAPRVVRVSSAYGDGAVFGVGMPIVLSAEPAPTDGRAFAAATKVTVNGEAVQGAWFWSKPYAGQPVQAHYRTEHYWPPNATIKLELPIGGKSAGKGLVFSDKLTSLTFRTGPKRVTTVNGRTLRATVEENDKVIRTMLVSLGADTPTTRTLSGIKLVMQKGEIDPATGRMRPDGEVSMSDTARTYTHDIVPWAVRITTSGEYLHDAYWNHQLGEASTSNGCTNLSPADGRWFYDFARIGDVVIHEEVNGPQVPSWDGYADWNTSWATWQRGGLLRNV